MNNSQELAGTIKFLAKMNAMEEADVTEEAEEEFGLELN